MSSVAENVFEKEFAGEALTDKPPEDIGKGEDDRINLAPFDLSFQDLQVHGYGCITGSLRDVNIFQFSVSFHGRHAEVAPDAALSESAERRFDVNARV